MTEAERVLAELAKYFHNSPDMADWTDLQTMTAPYLPTPAGVASYWPDDDGVMQPTNDAAAIQSLTAERDAALARVAEVGRIYKALVNLQDHARGAEQTFKTRLGARTKPTWFAVNALQDFVGFVGMWEECNVARALLEGSKP